MAGQSQGKGGGHPLALSIPLGSASLVDDPDGFRADSFRHFIDRGPTERDRSFHLHAVLTENPA